METVFDERVPPLLAVLIVPCGMETYFDGWNNIEIAGINCTLRNGNRLRAVK